MFAFALESPRRGRGSRSGFSAPHIICLLSAERSQPGTNRFRFARTPFHCAALARAAERSVGSTEFVPRAHRPRDLYKRRHGSQLPEHLLSTTHPPTSSSARTLHRGCPTSPPSPQCRLDG